MLLTLCGAEVLLRVIGNVSEDGAFYFLGLPCPPLKVPLASVEKNLAQFYNDPQLVLTYDPQLGWSPKPNSISRDGMYAFNNLGARSKKADQIVRPNSVEQVLLFGDSTMHGTGVQFEDSIGEKLQSLDPIKHYLNFAVGGYGIDQAYLRWRELQSEVKSKTIILGIQAENVKRNLNIFRAFYTNSGNDIPFSKPRFILEDQKLKLINSPTLEPKLIPEVLRNFSSSPLAKYEMFYWPEWYQDSSLYHSRLYSFIVGAIFLNNRYVVESNESAFYDENGEAVKLTLAILKQFKSEVEGAGGRLILVHLPRSRALKSVKNGDPLWYEGFLSALNKDFDVIDPIDNLLANRDPEQLYIDPWHYNASGAEIVAKTIF